jgi:hypothetical protein
MQLDDTVGILRRGAAEVLDVTGGDLDPNAPAHRTIFQEPRGHGRDNRPQEGAMTAENPVPADTKVYTTGDGRTVIEQSSGAVTLSADQIAAVIDQLRACYDYCATWKQPA